MDACEAALSALRRKALEPATAAAGLEAAAVAAFSPDARRRGAALAELRSIHAAVDAAPRDCSFFLAAALMEAGSFAEAREILERALERDAGDERAAALLTVLVAEVNRRGMRLALALAAASAALLVLVVLRRRGGRTPPAPSPPTSAAAVTAAVVAVAQQGAEKVALAVSSTAAGLATTPDTAPLFSRLVDATRSAGREFWRVLSP